MGLTSALFTGLSGLDVNQTRLNVIGNNIANVNTVAFKSSRATFTPEFYLTDRSGTQPTDIAGGGNPSQRGLGATVAAIQKDFTQGTLETTGKATDLAIDGNGFFVVDGANGKAYTREGDFGFNSNNELITNRGDYVMGYKADTTGKIIQGDLQKIAMPGNLTSEAKPTTTAKLQGNFNTDGAVASGASILDSAPLQSISAATLSDTSALTDLSSDGTTPLFVAGNTLTIEPTKGGRDLPPLTYKIDATSTIQNLKDFFDQGLQVKTDEPGPAGFDPAGAVFDTTTNTFKITGNAGKDNDISLAGTAFTSDNPNMNLTFANDALSNPAGESVYTSFQAFDSLGTPVNVNLTTVLQSKSDTGSTWKFIAASPDNTRAKAFDPTGASDADFLGATLSSGTVTFDNKGNYVTSTGTALTLDRKGTGATAAQNVTIDFKGMTALSSPTSNMVLDKQDGYQQGELNGYSFGADGVMSGSFSNGQVRTLGQLAIATFENPEGLVDNGANLYIAGANSGDALVTTPTLNSSGAVRAGSLEQSNVDISKEFINMITATTGFTAASRVITTSDQLITELMNANR